MFSGNINRSLDVDHPVSRETIREIEKDVDAFYDYLIEEYNLEVRSESKETNIEREVDRRIQISEP